MLFPLAPRPQIGRRAGRSRGRSGTWRGSGTGAGHNLGINSPITLKKPKYNAFSTCTTTSDRKTSRPEPRSKWNLARERYRSGAQPWYKLSHHAQEAQIQCFFHLHHDLRSEDEPAGAAVEVELGAGAVPERGTTLV